MVKHGTIFKGDFILTQESKEYLFFSNEWDNSEKFTKYIANKGAWNYIHDLKTNTVYYVTKQDNNGKTGVFGDFEHLQETYEILDNSLNYLKSK